MASETSLTESVPTIGLEGKGWSLKLPSECVVDIRSDGPDRVEKFVEFRSESLGIAGRVVVEHAPGEEWPTDSTFAIAAQDFVDRAGFVWIRRGSVTEVFAHPIEVGEFAFEDTRGVLATAASGGDKTVTVTYLFPDSLSTELRPVVADSLCTFSPHPLRQ